MFDLKPLPNHIKSRTANSVTYYLT